MIGGRTVALTLALGLMLTVPSVCADHHQEPADDSPCEVAWVWFDTLYEVVKSEATAPPPAARIYGVAAVAFCEAVVPGTLHHRSLLGQLHGIVSVPQPQKHAKYHWPTVVNTALGRTIRGLFPSLTLENLTAINILEQVFATRFQAGVKKKDYVRFVAHGQAVADAILA